MDKQINLYEKETNKFKLVISKHAREDGTYYNRVTYETKTSCWTDYPVRWPDGTLAWDRPEALPVWVREKANNLF